MFVTHDKYAGLLVQKWPDGSQEFLGAFKSQRVRTAIRKYSPLDIIDLNEHTKETLIEVLADYILEQKELNEDF